MKKIFPIVILTLVTLAQPGFAQKPAPSSTSSSPAPASTPPAQTDADYQARVDKARIAMGAVSADKIVDQILAGISKNPNAHLSAADIAEIRSSIDIAGLNKVTLDALVKTFTLKELTMLGDFYGSPTGQSITKKMPVYMGVVMPAIQQQVKQAVIAHMQKMKQQGASAPAAGPMSVPAQH